MVDELYRGRIEIKAIVIGYAMSRLDREYLQARQLPFWDLAFEEAEKALQTPSTSFKNLRDEFDPVHDNPRLG